MTFSLFRRQQPLPPKIPQWVTISVPIIVGIMFALIGLVYNTMAADVKSIKVQVEKVDEKKVDNETLKLMLKNQEMMIKQQKEQADRQRADDAKKFDEIQKTQTQTLQRIETMQVGKGDSQRISSPSRMRIKSSTEVKKVSLTPEQFEKYMSLKPEIRLKYKAYLEKSGKDVSGLPD